MSADDLKAQGNRAFAAKDWATAIDLFTQAIVVAPENHVLYSNRSAAYSSCGEYQKALEDADKCVSIKPDWPKGYNRKATAQAFMHDTDAAMETYETGLEKCPGDPTLTKGLKDLASSASGSKDPMQQLSSLFTAPDLWAKVAMNPDTRHLVGNQKLQKDIDEIKANPSILMAKMQQNEDLMAILGVVMGMPTAPKKDDAGASTNDTDVDMAEATQEEAVHEIDPEEIVVDEVEEKRLNALSEKELGNAAYKKRDFDTAIAHYEKAIELHPENMAFYNNMSAVYFEQKDYEKCREMCKKAVEVGQEQRAEYALIAKAYARIGNSYHKEGNYDDAATWLNRSLTEHRTKDTLNKLNAIEKEKKEAEAKALLNPEEATRIKEEGNAMFKAMKYPEAIKLYTEALTRNPDDHTIYSNRAASYMKLGEFPHSLKDCDKCIAMAPDFIKGHTRRGNCLLAMREHQRALEAFEKALSIDKDNKEAIDGVQRAYRAMNERLQNMSEEERAAEAMKDPEVQAIMGDPVMRIVLDQMQNDPAAAQEHLKNPEISAKLQKLINAGIIRTR
ncbi:hypothetical protein SARC_04819 [Sphaeroforma arctica JP610]|uniref:STI1 domain-containing protein n=1 Tax=Sphaeroforma arctica JP610 TaxID=667725 RepID=A0A0L0G234_9EUKA|nr:hypothetical protein SARC_04819 [Sphaeroforma arctica JP610]KNC82899.1 hypothetical protein SARC_04819 [Sphaeroforma arctica JP610]|eukprot:XP_014156801.1 hypothetical protein SARC_04819 [Sphaeroforma arctica JP610]